MRRSPLRSKPRRTDKAAVAELFARSGGRCEITAAGDRCPNRATAPHHRQLRSQGGTDELANLIHVCDRDHRRIHMFPARSYEHGLLVKSWADPAEIAWR